MKPVDLVKEAKLAVAAAPSLEALEQLRVKYLGRSGLITELLRGVGQLPVSQRSAAGQLANQARQDVMGGIEQRQAELEANALTHELSRGQLDISAPVLSDFGHDHPISSLLNDIVRLFWQMGFNVVQGPEIETPWYNFEALNIPVDHPARDMQDTFYLEGSENLPRTHTSGMQIRYMEQNQPPIRIISPGKVYRNEDEDARHIWSFMQVEGLVIDEGIGVADLKGTLLAMVKGVLGDQVEIRLRPNYFPYTEPSIEIDASCVVCHKKGCSLCSYTGWVELLGSGMVHPQVLMNVGMDPSRFSGFAFGVGLERLAAVKYQVPDLREFWRPNLKFLEQF